MFPPHDLLSLASIGLKENHNVYFTDAVAEGLNEEAIKSEISRIQPDLIISIMSFELFDLDTQVIRRIKEDFPKIIYGVFGHYPTNFAKETLLHTHADFVMLGEPDDIFEKLLQTWQDNELPTDVDGTIVRRHNQDIIENNGGRRVPNPNLLPLPSYELLKTELYKEPFMKHPLGVIQTARGCPFKCNYCVHSIGTKSTMLTPEKVIEHILYLKNHKGIKAIRFIDDTFTAIPSRVIEICRLMIVQNVNLPWTCLSRADTLNEEMLKWMKKAGCLRINVGMESGSQRILNILNKGLNVELAMKNLLLAKKIGIETMGFFLTGVPGETEQDVSTSIAFAKKAFSYAVADNLIVYPGTPLYEKFGHLINFNLVPYHNEFSDYEFREMANRRRSRFYREFYFSFNFLINSPKKVFFQPLHLKTLMPFVLKIAVGKKRPVQRGLIDTLA